MDKCIFVDSDVLIDVFAKRMPFYSDSSDFLTYAEEKKFQAYTSPLILANVYYVLKKFGGKMLALSTIRKTRTFINIVDINQSIIDKAINSDFSDFEDAIQSYSAENAVMDIIVTRNIDHYKNSKLSVLLPGEVIALY